MTQSVPHPVLIFDGECALCSRSVRFMLRWERKPGVVRFAPMQADPARDLLRAHGFDPDALTSVVLIEPTEAGSSRVLVRSRAVLGLAAYLRAPFSWAAIARVIPPALLDPFYRLLAKNRYRVFGKVDRCVIDERIVGRTL